MKRIAPAIMRRAASSATRRPRSRTEAAVALVRAEFERERLDRDLALLDRRASMSTEARDAAARRSRVLRAMLADAADGGGA